LKEKFKKYTSNCVVMSVRRAKICNEKWKDEQGIECKQRLLLQREHNR
jgi:hypothetical protein